MGASRIENRGHENNMNNHENDTNIKVEWRGKEFSFFNHKSCEYFPCHKGVKEEEFNCLFCYCPLYALKDRCGGNFKYTDDGIKDCSACAVPHHRKNYGYIIGKFTEIVKITKRDRK